MGEPVRRPPFRAACVQMRSGLDRARNTQAAITLIEEAAQQGAAFIATPEMTNVIDRKPDRLFESLPEEDALPEIPAFAETARRLGVWILVGSLAVRVAKRRAANRAFLFAPDGRIAARYDKIHMFDVDLPNGESWRESNVYAPGDRAPVVDTPLAKIGLSICYDLRFPHLYRGLSQAGAEVLTVPAAFTRQTGEAHWHVLLRARAIETGSYVIAPAQGGTHEDGRETYGHSLIVDPWGRVLAEKADDEPGVITAVIDPSASADARARIPNLKLEKSPEILSLRS